MRVGYKGCWGQILGVNTGGHGYRSDWLDTGGIDTCAPK